MGKLTNPFQAPEAKGLISYLPEQYENLSRLSPRELKKRLEDELVIRKETDKISFFTPNGPQKQFIDIIGSGNSFISIFSAGNGTGKTTLATTILGNAMWGPQNSWFDHPIFRKWPYPKRARYITDPKLLEEIGPFSTEIKTWWPNWRYEALKAGQKYFSQYKSESWVIDVMSYEQQVREFEGGTLGLIIFDEPPPRPIWNACISRLRKGGIIIVLMTPLTLAGWFYDEIVPDNQNSLVYAGMEDNCKTHGVRGVLEHDHIDKLIKNMPPEEVEARVYGRAMYLKGLVFKTYDPRIHVLKEPFRPPLGSTIYNVVDPHGDKPFFSIWAYPASNGDLIVFEEHPNENFFQMHNCQLDITDYKRIYADKEQGYHVKRVIDRHFADTTTAAWKKTLRQELQDIGMNYDPSYSASEEISTGVIALRKRLNYNTNQPISSTNRPSLYINPHCINTQHALSRWSWDEKKQRYSDNFKDPIDVLRYLVMANPVQDSAMPKNPARRYG